MIINQTDKRHWSPVCMAAPHPSATAPSPSQLAAMWGFSAARRPSPVHKHDTCCLCVPVPGGLVFHVSLCSFLFYFDGLFACLCLSISLSFSFHCSHLMNQHQSLIYQSFSKYLSIYLSISLRMHKLMYSSTYTTIHHTYIYLLLYI